MSRGKQKGLQSEAPINYTVWDPELCSSQASVARIEVQIFQHSFHQLGRFVCPKTQEIRSKSLPWSNLRIHLQFHWDFSRTKNRSWSQCPQVGQWKLDLWNLPNCHLVLLKHRNHCIVLQSSWFSSVHFPGSWQTENYYQDHHLKKLLWGTGHGFGSEKANKKDGLFSPDYLEAYLRMSTVTFAKGWSTEDLWLGVCFRCSLHRRYACSRP